MVFLHQLVHQVLPEPVIRHILPCQLAVDNITVEDSDIQDIKKLFPVPFDGLPCTFYERVAPVQIVHLAHFAVIGQHTAGFGEMSACGIVHFPRQNHGPRVDSGQNMDVTLHFVANISPLLKCSRSPLDILSMNLDIPFLLALTVPQAPVWFFNK